MGKSKLNEQAVRKEVVHVLVLGPMPHSELEAHAAIGDGSFNTLILDKVPMQNLAKSCISLLKVFVAAVNYNVSSNRCKESPLPLTFSVGGLDRQTPLEV